MITKLYCCLLVMAGILSNVAAQQTLWSVATKPTQTHSSISINNKIDRTLYTKLDLSAFHAFIKTAPLERADGFAKGIPLSIPLPDGKMLHTSILESPLWQKGTAPLDAEVRTYVLTNPLTKAVDGRLTVTPLGISGILFSEGGIVYMNPISNGNAGDHQLYYTSDVDAVNKIKCGSIENLSSIVDKGSRTAAGDGKRRTYRVAIATTGEYTAWAGGQANAITHMTITINNINAIYNRDLNVLLTIVTDNSILFTDGATDPYTQPAGWEIPSTNANQTTLDNAIGTANYDVGIVFNKGWDKGYAPTGIVCKPTEKGKSGAGYSLGKGLNPVDGPQGPLFDFTVAHEMGHDFGAAHTMASNAGFCAPYGNAATAYEPGAGNTIMSYAGYSDCGSYVFNEPYFHAGTIAQIHSYILSQACGKVLNISNSAPVVTVPAASYNVPVSTPFILTGSGYDAEGNTILFNWEQMNAAFTVTPPPATNAAGPNFRSYPPSVTGNVRSFPKMSDIAAGISPLYEVLPSVNRTMNFRLTARDQSFSGGATGEANVTVNFYNTAGPFIVTSQPTAVTWAANGTNTQTITWNVAGTNAGSVNCSAVSIMLSTDGGLTFPYTILSSTANDGSEVITVPNVATQAGRIKVQGVNNIFFNISKANITIISSCGARGSKIATVDSITLPAGNALLNLALTPQYGTAFNPSGTITSANPSTPLIINKTDLPGCAYYGGFNTFKYNVHPFVVNTAGNYTFTWPAPTPYGLIYNLYYENFDPAFPCLNFMASNTVTSAVTPTTINASLTANLSPGAKYVLVVGTFSATFPALPATYSVSVSGGGVYNSPPSPGAAYTYMYVVVDNTTNLIKAIATSADLSNSVTYPAGTSYSIYGLSYANSSPALTGYVGTNFNTLSNAMLNDANLCGNLSTNRLKVKVISPTYTFTGMGNWSVATNWSGNAIPPSPLPAGCEIIIDPQGAGESIADMPITILQGAKLTIADGKKIRVPGNLMIQN